MSSWSCDQMVCCSCRYWGGSRKIDFWATFFDAIEEEGNCYNPEGYFRGCKKYAGSSCEQWESFKN